MDGVMHRSRTMIPPTPAGLQWGEQSGGRLERGPMAEMFCFLFVTGGFTDIYNGHISNYMYLDAVYCIEIIPQ